MFIFFGNKNDKIISSYYYKNKMENYKKTLSNLLEIAFENLYSQFNDDPNECCNKRVKTDIVAKFNKVFKFYCGSDVILFPDDLLDNDDYYIHFHTELQSLSNSADIVRCFNKHLYFGIIYDESPEDLKRTYSNIILRSIHK
jgi:hypothetical protein